MVLVLDKVVRPPNVSVRGGDANGAYFYVPANATHIEYVWGSPLPTSDSKPVAAPVAPHALVDPAGVIFPITTGPQELIRHPVPVQHRNKLWRIIRLAANQLWFFNIPPYLAESPSAVMVPRNVAVANELHIVE